MKQQDTGLPGIMHFLVKLITIVGKAIECLLKDGISKNHEVHLVGLSHMACTLFTKIAELKLSLQKLGGDRFLQITQTDALKSCDVYSTNLESTKGKPFSFSYKGGVFEGTIRGCAVANEGDFFEQVLLLIPEETFQLENDRVAAAFVWSCDSPNWTLKFGPCILKTGILRIKER